MTLKTILRRLIQEKGVTVAALSRHTGVPLQTLHGWLNGNEPKRISQLKLVADFFEVTVDYLCFSDSKLKLKSKNLSLWSTNEEVHSGIYEVTLRKIQTPSDNSRDDSK